ncbi:MAG TPA: malto-oligosyltrehalose trehalohydrolase [Chryseosolibacter sp.]
MVYPAVGSFADKNTCSFTVWAPCRKKVEVVLCDRKTIHPLEKENCGYWTCTVPEAEPGTRYLFRLDGDNELPDPASRAQADGVHGPSTVIREDYSWTDSAWKGLPLGDMIIYELHVGTFSPAHDFRGVMSRLPHFKRLGVNTLELMPVAQFPGERNWGYDGVFPFAVQQSYGGATGLKDLVNEAHREGIAIMLDVVYNHLGPEGNYLQKYGPYFTDRHRTGWGQAINFDGPWSDGVRSFFLQNALMWLEDFHIDGLRLDAVHAIWDSSALHFTEELVMKTRALEKECGRKKVLVAELDLNDPRYILPPAKGGYGLDGQWSDEFHHALHSLLTGEVNGYYEDFGSTSHLAKAVSESYVYTGEYSVHRKRHFGRKPVATTFDQFVVFAQNHDQVGNRMLGDRLSSLVSKEALKLAAVTYLLSPHVPMLFMGEEYGEKNPFHYFVSHSDEELVSLVRSGRQQEFSYFNWTGDIPDPQARRTFEESVLSWKVDTDEGSRTLFRLYAHLIGLRKTRPALSGKSRDTLRLLSSDGGILCFEVRHLNDCLTIILNFSKEEVGFALPHNRQGKKIFDSASAEWGGPGEGRAPAAGEKQLTLMPQSAQIFEE